MQKKINTSKKNKPSTSFLTPLETLVETNELVLPSHANVLGTLFGGQLMSWIDICAAICAQRYSRRVAVTASVDGLSFLAPIYVGDAVTLKARIVYTGKTSMVVLVEVTAARHQTGEYLPCVTAYLNFVAVDDQRKPTAVPPLDLKSAEDKKLADWAERRRKLLREPLV